MFLHVRRASFVSLLQGADDIALLKLRVSTHSPVSCVGNGFRDSKASPGIEFVVVGANADAKEGAKEDA